MVNVKQKQLLILNRIRKFPHNVTFYLRNRRLELVAS